MTHRRIDGGEDSDEDVVVCVATQVLVHVDHSVDSHHRSRADVEGCSGLLGVQCSHSSNVDAAERQVDRQ